MLAYYAIYESRDHSRPPRGICVLDPRTGDALIWNHRQQGWQVNPELVSRLVFQPQNQGRTEEIDRATAERVTPAITEGKPLPAEDAIAKLLQAKET